MQRRILLLIAYRLIFVASVLLYHLLALLFELPGMAFGGVFALCLIQLLLSGVYFWIYNHPRIRKALRSFVFAQFTLDIVVISGLLIYIGVDDSSLRYVYLIVILLSAVFLDKVSIYAVTVVSLSAYILSVQVITASKGGSFFPIQHYDYALSQVLFCLLTALLSTFMQSAYLSSRKTILEKEERIRWLRVVRRKIIENLPSGLIICDGKGLITFANPVSMKLLDRPGGELVGVNAWQLFQIEAPHDPPQVKQPRMQRLETTLTIGNARKIFGLGYTGMERETGDMGYMVVFQDLTHVKILEQQRQLADRMRAIAKVAAGVAHEIRNPLAAISGSIQVLKEFLPEDKTAEELVEIVDRETKRLNNIVSDFLAYARPVAVAPFKTVDLAVTVREFMRLTKNDVQLQTLALRFDSDGQHAWIQADEARLTQVWWNLLRNAYQASDEGGKVWLSVAVETDSVCFMIKDEGVGMNEAQLNDLFTPFQSFSKTGSGLGMSIVYDIVKLHHGEIDVWSEPGKGTAITIRFPKFQE